MSLPRLSCLKFTLTIWYYNEIQPLQCQGMPIRNRELLSLLTGYRKVYRHRPISTVTSHCVLALLLHGGPYSMIINDGVDKKVLQNILIGEVWICSGQSNMEFPIRGDWARLMDADQIVASMHHPALRLMQIKNTTSLAPLDDAAVEYGWIESSPSAASFSAIGYLYGTMLQDSLNIPIGIIDATWGGTDIEAWTPQKSLRNVPEIKNINRLARK